RREEGEAREVVAVRVRDDGAGVPADLMPWIFDLFVQGERPQARSGGGLGVGLTLGRQLVELHGGTVGGESAGPGKGGTFTVRLPLVEAPSQPAGDAAAAENQPASGGATRRVLVVDDIADSADSLAMLVRLSGHDVKVVYNGPDAIAAVAEFRPEIVLLDIALRGMDGYEVAKQIRQQPASGNIAVVAVTGFSQERDRRMSSESGFTHYLTKPVDPELLRKLLTAAG